MAKTRAKPSKPPGTDWALLAVAALVYSGMVSRYMAALRAALPPLAAAAFNRSAHNSSPHPLHCLQYAATAYFFAETPTPLPDSANPTLFSEGRVLRHLHHLAEEIGHRQVCLCCCRAGCRRLCGCILRACKGKVGMKG